MKNRQIHVWIDFENPKLNELCLKYLIGMISPTPVENKVPPDSSIFGLIPREIALRIFELTGFPTLKTLTLVSKLCREFATNAMFAQIHENYDLYILQKRMELQMPFRKKYNDIGYNAEQVRIRFWIFDLNTVNVRSLQIETEDSDLDFLIITDRDVQASSHYTLRTNETLNVEYNWMHFTSVGSKITRPENAERITTNSINPENLSVDSIRESVSALLKAIVADLAEDIKYIDIRETVVHKITRKRSVSIAYMVNCLVGFIILVMFSMGIVCFTTPNCSLSQSISMVVVSILLMILWICSCAVISFFWVMEEFPSFMPSKKKVRHTRYHMSVRLRDYDGCF